MYSIQFQFIFHTNNVCTTTSTPENTDRQETIVIMSETAFIVIRMCFQDEK
jgi:hypothetical protein